MTTAAIIMFAVAAIALLGGLFLLWRMRGGRLGAPGRYGHFMSAVMLIALGVVLAIFAGAQVQWAMAT